MNQFVDRLVSDDFLWQAINANLSGRRKISNGYININCPMCVSRGEGADRRMRCGVKNTNLGIGINCFNCGFKTVWRPGELISRNMREFLANIGIPDSDIKRINHRAMTYRSIIETSPEAAEIIPDYWVPKFDSVKLPSGSKTFREWLEEGCTDENFLNSVAYIESRGNEVAGHTFYWTPNTRDDMNRRVIIPCYHEGRIIGYTMRSCVPDLPQRYLKNLPPNYLFNVDTMKNPRRSITIIVEGVFDALAISGVGLLGSTINRDQAQWLKQYGKTLIYLPDRDSKGLKAIDYALEHGWGVAFPFIKNDWWDSDVKDAADAVKKYGRLYTLISVVRSAVFTPTEINVKRKLVTL
jgi:hypothetical protein